MIAALKIQRKDGRTIIKNGICYCYSEFNPSYLNSWYITTKNEIKDIKTINSFEIPKHPGSVSISYFLTEENGMYVGGKTVVNDVYSSSHQRIKKAVLEYYDIEEEDFDLNIGNNARLYSTPRHVISTILRTIYPLRDKDIGKFMGGKDHATVLSSYKVIKGWIESKDKETLDVIKYMSVILDRSNLKNEILKKFNYD